jgi:hypothetical protein
MLAFLFDIIIFNVIWVSRECINRQTFLLDDLYLENTFIARNDTYSTKNPCFIINLYTILLPDYAYIDKFQEEGIISYAKYFNC